MWTGQKELRLTMHGFSGYGDISKPHGQLRGRGPGSQMTILLHKQFLIKVSKKGVKNPTNLLMWFLDSLYAYAYVYFLFWFFSVWFIPKL